MTAAVSVVAWDFDGVLNRNVVDGRFTWLENFDRDTGQSAEVFVDEVFARELDALVTGREDLRDRVEQWARKVGYKPGADGLLDYWFNVDVRLDENLIATMGDLAASGIRQVMVTNNEARRTRFIEQELEFGPRLEQIFASGRLGVAKPDAQFYGAVTNTLQVEPEEILILDDLNENVEAAIRCGWQGLHFTPANRAKIDTLLTSLL